MAELQGTLRKEKDALGNFEDKCEEIIEKLEDLAGPSIDQLQRLNKEMLSSCILFENRGNYSQAEIDWYSEQMKEIDEMLVKAKEEREEKLKELRE